MPGAILGQRGGHEIGARDHAGAVARHVGVDRVAHEEEEVHRLARHRAEDPVAAVDEPTEAAAAEIAAPQERHARGLGGRRGRGELALDALAPLAHGVPVARRRAQPLERHAHDQIVGLRRLARQPPRHGAGGADLDGDLAGMRGPRPQDGRRGAHLGDRDQHRGGRRRGRAQQQQEEGQPGVPQAQRRTRPKCRSISASKLSSV